MKISTKYAYNPSILINLVEGKGVNLENDKFYQWAKLKIRLQRHSWNPNFKEGEVWWAAVGKNLGVESNGKHENFSRPVLIYKKINRHEFMAIPLTTKHHGGNWYIPIHLHSSLSRAVLVQARIMSSRRLYQRFGRISYAEYEKVRKGFIKIYG